jgi:PilZ domain
MAPLVAQLRTERDEADQRGSARRTLNLRVGSQYLDAEALVLIHNLSQNGILIETLAPLQLGETIEVAMPRIGPTPARIVRADGDHYGCRFLSPISRGAVSAALLRSPAAAHEDPPAPVPATMADVLREDIWREIERDIAPIERALLYGFLILAGIAVAAFIYALFALVVTA